MQKIYVPYIRTGDLRYASFWCELLDAIPIEKGYIYIRHVYNGKVSPH